MLTLNQLKESYAAFALAKGVENARWNLEDIPSGLGSYYVDIVSETEMYLCHTERGIESSRYRLSSIVEFCQMVFYLNYGSKYGSVPAVWLNRKNLAARQRS